MTGLPFETRTRVGTHSAFVQDQSTFGRLTLQGALRFDYAYSRFKDQQVGPERFIPVAIVLPAQDGVLGFKDLSPRVGAAYDLTGDGKTSVKVNWGRYLEPAANGGRYTATNPLSRIVTSTTRSWTDANRNFVADCDLLNPTAQDLRATGGDFCGAWDNRNFGSSVIEHDPRSRRCSRAGACGRTTASSGISRAAGGLRAGRRSKSATTGDGSAISTSPTTCSSLPRTTTRTR